jgi:hypothetical protein
MENASVKIMLPRMQELWLPGHTSKGEELERQLWAQTCLETSALDAVAEKGAEDDDGAIQFSLHEDIDILVLDGHMGKQSFTRRSKTNHQSRPTPPRERLLGL